MRRIVVLAALGVVLGLGGCAKIAARDLIREGNTLYNEGRYREAIAKYDDASELEPDGVTVYWNRACAAESLVLKLKDPTAHEERREYAEMALRDFQKWYDRLENKGPEDGQQLHDHRLAILDADERCDDLLTYWLEKHRGNPREEALYGVIARVYEKCGQNAAMEEWYVKRTTDFGETSVKAWHTLAIHRFDPLWPDPDSGLPYNEQVNPSDRIAVADQVIALLDKATAIDHKFRDAYVWRSMAYTQRGLARVVIDNAVAPEEKLEAILAREDSMLAWKQQKAVCDLDELPECPTDSVPPGPCCPPPPLTAEDQTADLEVRRQLEEEIRKAQEAAQSGKKKRRRRRRKR